MLCLSVTPVQLLLHVLE